MHINMRAQQEHSPMTYEWDQHHDIMMMFHHHEVMCCSHSRSCALKDTHVGLLLPSNDVPSFVGRRRPTCAHMLIANKLAISTSIIRSWGWIIGVMREQALSDTYPTTFTCLLDAPDGAFWILLIVRSVQHTSSSRTTTLSKRVILDRGVGLLDMSPTSWTQYPISTPLSNITLTHSC